MLFIVNKGGIVHKSKLKGITLAVLMAFAPIAADAAGLGRLTVTSGLGEPLSAEIELLSPTPEELASLSAGIASPEAYSVQGVERTALHSAIKVDVTKRGDGTPILKLTTRQAVSDPFLDMLIQVDWETGRLLREYTVLLDPPGYSNQAQVYNGVQLPPDANTPSVAPAGRAASAASGNAAKTPARNSTKNSARTNTANQTATPAPRAATSAPVSSTPVAASDTPAQNYTTAKGDTLSAIAQQHQVEGVSLDQMLIGLYRANEDAFSNKNMNRLKTGQIMRVPAASELQQVSPAEATREVRAHSSDWNAYRNRLAGLAAESNPAAEGGTQQSASGRITSAATDRAAPADAGLRDVIKLSRSDAKGKAAAQEQINALQEELTAKDKSLNDSAERLAALEKQISDMQKLLAIRNQSLANLQNKDATPAPAAPPVQAEAPKPAETPKPAEATKPEVAAEPAKAETATPEPANTDPSVATLAEPAPQAADETSKVQKAEKPATPAVVPPPAVEEPSLIGEILGDDPLLPALAGGALVLLLGGWLFLRNRRKRELDSFEKGILTSGGLKANTVFGNTAAGATVNAGDTSFLTDFSPNTGGMIDTHDVDPIAEAEVYMAYGRDAQAEEILKDAIVKEPQRHELHVKLLEIYAARNDTSAFETVAGEIYTTLGAADPIWAKVAEMGRKLEPNNPLYSAEVESKAISAKANAASDGLATDGFVSATTPDSNLTTAAGAALAGAAAAGLYAASSQEQQAGSENADGSDEVDHDTFKDNTFDQNLLGAESNALEPDFGAPKFGNTAERSELADLELGDLSSDPQSFSAQPVSTPDAADELPSLDFDLGGLGDSTAQPADVDAAAHGGNDIEFALDLPEPPAKNTLQMDIAELDAEIPDFDLPELGTTDEDAALPDLDLPEFSFPESSAEKSIDEVGSAQAAASEASTSDAEALAGDALAGDTAAASLPELSAPDFDLSEEIAPPAGSVVEDVDFGLPEIELPEIELPSPAAEVEADSDLPNIDFDLPEISFGESNDLGTEQELPAANVSDDHTADADNAAIEDFLASESTAAEPDVGVLDLSDLESESDADAKVEANDSVPHFNFEDIDLAGGESVGNSAAVDETDIALPDFDYPATEPAAPLSVEIDISNIDLNVADNASGTTGVETGSLADESPDVDTKLDLVTAYMDMGDNEGARELLEEILKEGGPRQKAKAQTILDDLA